MLDATQIPLHARNVNPAGLPTSTRPGTSVLYRPTWNSQTRLHLFATRGFR
jgi:hypothetical protein